MTMLDECMTALAFAHEDKAFDVVATICDGAAEHRTAQKDSATFTFADWAKADDDFEQSFRDFPVAFKHPHHGKPVFNLSDPPHLLKKLVNALHHSDLPWKARNLTRPWTDPATGEYDLIEFSLSTLEKVYYNEELGGGGLTRGEQAASLQRFGSMKPEQFNWNSYNCMDVGLAAKDICEHRFGHIRAGQGTHKNPKKEEAYGAGLRADQIRNAQQSRRRSSDRSDVSPRLDLGGTAAFATLPVCAKQRNDPMRAERSDRADYVFEPRSLRRWVDEASDVEANIEGPSLGASIFAGPGAAYSRWLFISGVMLFGPEYSSSAVFSP